MKRICAGIALFVITAWTFGASAERFGDVSVEILGPPDESSFHGYADYRLIVTNHSSRTPHEVSVHFPTGSYSDIRISCVVTAPPNTTVSKPLFQPAISTYASYGFIRIDGGREREIKFPNVRHGRGSEIPFVLVSRSLNRDDLVNTLKKFADEGLVPHSGIRKKLSKKKKRKRKETKYCQMVRAEADSAEWSENWLSYTRYDGIVLSNEDMGTMPGPVRSALGAYLKCGGILLVTGDFSPPDSWKRNGRNSKGGLNVYSAGFGLCLTGVESDTSTFTAEQLDFLLGVLKQSLKPFKIADRKLMKEHFPVVEDMDINIKGFVFLIIVFAVLVGPVNLVILSKKKRRIWLLWTIPGISLLTCASIFAYALFSEGIDSDVRTAGFTILDEISHEASTIGITSFYCRLAPSDGLYFSNRTELTPVDFSNRYYNEVVRTVDWADRQHLKYGWVQSRIPTYLLVRKHERRRERLKVNFSNPDGPSAVNGLGAPIKHLRLADGDGKIYTGTNIPAGAKAILKHDGKRVYKKRNRKTLAEIYPDFPVRMTKYNRHESGYLRSILVRNSYVAILEDCPFIENGLENADNFDLAGTVFGIMQQ